MSRVKFIAKFCKVISKYLMYMIVCTQLLGNTGASIMGIILMVSLIYELAGEMEE